MLKVEKQFILREIAGDYVIIPVGKSAQEFNGMITVNNSGALMWDMLVKGTTEEALLNMLLESYEVSEKTAKADIKKFLDELLKYDIVCKTESEEI